MRVLHRVTTLQGSAIAAQCAHAHLCTLFQVLPCCYLQFQHVLLTRPSTGLQQPCPSTIASGQHQSAHLRGCM